jgi:hypothetical protein
MKEVRDNKSKSILRELRVEWSKKEICIVCLLTAMTIKHGFFRGYRVVGPMIICCAGSDDLT